MKTPLSALLLLTILFLHCSGRVPRQSSNKVRRLPSLNVCGLSSMNIVTKIIGGSPAEPGEFPWMAVIGYKYGGYKDIVWNCGGSLITDQYVLTAAHCVHPSVIRAPGRRPLTVSMIRLGELDLNPNVGDMSSPVDIGVEQIIPHSQYSNREKVNDIALIKMKSKVMFTKNIKPICLPPPEFDTKNFEGFSPTVAGWGKTIESETRSDTRLLKAELEIKDTTSCGRNLTSIPNLSTAILDSRVLCAYASGKDSCQGDSGGPLMLPRKLRKTSINYFQMGIVSYGYGCAREGYPGVYTRVSKFMTWIISNLDI